MSDQPANFFANRLPASLCIFAIKLQLIPKIQQNIGQRVRYNKEIVMFIFCLASWYMLATLFYKRGGGVRRAIIVSYVLYTLLQVISLEVLSIFGAISFASLAIFWAVLTGILVAIDLLQSRRGGRYLPFVYGEIC